MPSSDVKSQVCRQQRFVQQPWAACGEAGHSPPSEGEGATLASG